MAEVLIAIFGAAIFTAGYYSLPAPNEKAKAAIAKTPPPIYEQSAYWASSSDTIRFNTAKRPVLSMIGQFGLKEEYVPDGLGCLTRIGNVDIDKF